MSFTEMVFEVRDERYPLCRLTQQDAKAHAVCRVVGGNGPGSTMRALVTLAADETARDHFVRDLRLSHRCQQVEVVSRMTTASTISVAQRLDGGPSALAPVEPLAAAFGSDVLIDPVVFRDGAARVRALVPDVLGAHDALLRLRKVQAEVAWRGFRVLGATSLDIPCHVRACRRLLEPDDEGLLQLAVSQGYYDSPKRATLHTLAQHVGSSVSPIHKRLKIIEGALVSAYVHPGVAVEAPRRRGRASAPEDPASFEFAVRARGPHHPLLSFSQRAPRSQILLQALPMGDQEDEVALVAALAPVEGQENLLSLLRGHSAVAATDVLSRTREAVLLRVRAKHRKASASDVHPFACIPSAEPEDLATRPALIEAGELRMRVLLPRATGLGAARERIDALARECAWDGHQVTGQRRLGTTFLPVAPPGRLTHRQEEVLKIAHALGYYETPRRCTLSSVAQTLGVSANAIHKNLAAAEFGVVTGYLAGSL